MDAVSFRHNSEDAEKKSPSMDAVPFWQNSVGLERRSPSMDEASLGHSSDGAESLLAVSFPDCKAASSKSLTGSTQFERHFSFQGHRDAETCQDEVQPAQVSDVAPEVSEDGPGLYTLTRAVFVAPDCNNLDPDDDELVEELEPGEQVWVQEVVLLKEEERLRARIEEPAGWISILNTSSGRRWARRAEDAEESDGPGTYVLLANTVVAPSSACLTPMEEQEVDDLDQGDEVEVLEVVDLKRFNRIRARLKCPAGWITLCNTNNETRFAKRIR